MAVNAFLKRSELEDFIHGELALCCDFAFNGHGPGRSTEVLGISCGLVLVDAELVEIIVVRGILVGGFLFRSAEGALDQASELCRSVDISRWGGKVQKIPSGERGDAGDAHGLKELAAVEIEIFGSDVSVG